MRDKGKGLRTVRDGSKEVDGERLGRKGRSKSLLVMLSAVYRRVRQILNFARHLGVAKDKAELRELHYLIMLFELSFVLFQAPADTVCTYTQYFILAPPPA